MKKGNNTLLTCICAAAIALLTYFVFSPSLDDGFTNWDDPYYVTDNPLVVNNSVPLVKIFETPVAANYHPITILSLALNYQVGKLDPFGYHLENVIFHVLNTLLVFLFIFLLTRRNLLMAAIVSLFFGIHPMHVESVSWISERKDVLYVFFFLSGLVTYLRYSETRKMVWYFFTLLLFILSCLSKGVAVIFPVILLLIDYLNGIKWDKRLITEKIPFFLLALVFGVITIKAQQSVQALSAINTFTIFQRLLFASYASILYIVKLFVPFKLSAFYPYPIINSSDSVPLIFYFSSLVLLGILASLVYFFLKKEKEIVFGLLFYLISVALVLQFISVGTAIIADRYSYLSYVGLLFVAAYLINKAWQSKNNIWASMKYPFIAITIIGAVIFSYQVYSRTQVWKNSDVLWTDAIDNYPDASVPYYERALLYSEEGKNDSALADYSKLIEIAPHYAAPYVDRGLLYFNSGRNNLALSDYNKAIELDSGFADAYHNRGLIYASYNKTNLAIANISKAIAINDTFKRAYFNRALLYSRERKSDSALEDFTKVIELDPSYANAYNNCGMIYLNEGKYDLALTNCSKARGLNPAYAPFYYSCGLCYNALNQYEQAADDFTKGIQLHPQQAELYYNMRGVCHLNLNKYSESIDDFSKAIELNSSVAGFWLNRSLAENKAGQNEMAKADALKAQQLQGR